MVLPQDSPIKNSLEWIGAICLITCIIRIFIVYSTYMSLSPTTSGQTSLIPVNDCVLIKLDRTDRREGKYDTRTSGILISLPMVNQNQGSSFKGMDTFPTQVTNNGNNLIGKRVYFEEFKEGARIKRDGELFCFIKIEDIRGYEDVET